MFQLVMFLVINGQMVQPRVLPDPTFSSYVECAETIPEHVITFNKAFEVHGQPFVLALGCMKTGEKS